MCKQKNRIILGILFIAALVSFLPSVTQAATVHLQSFQSGSGVTGEIYGGTAKIPPFYYCIDPNPTVYVPGDYTYTPQQLTGSGLQAAWLMNQYAPAFHGEFGTWSSHSYNYLETGLAVQLAIWHVLGFTGKTSTSSDINALASYLQSIVPAPSALTALSGPLGVGPYYAMVGGSDLGTLTQPLIGGPGSPVTTVNPVPLPPSVWLLGSGLLGLVGLRRRFKSYSRK